MRVMCNVGILHFQIIHSADVTSSLRLQPMALLVLAVSSIKSHLRMPVYYSHLSTDACSMR